MAMEHLPISVFPRLQHAHETFVHEMQGDVPVRDTHHLHLLHEILVSKVDLKREVGVQGPVVHAEPTDLIPKKAKQPVFARPQHPHEATVSEEERTLILTDRDIHLFLLEIPARTRFLSTDAPEN